MRGLLALWLLACSTRAHAPGGANGTATQLVARAGDDAMRAHRRLSVTYQELAKLVAADAAAGDNFGYSVAIDGGIIVAGAPYDSDGSVYVFSPPAPTVQPTPRPTWTFQPTPQPTVSPKPTTPQPSTAALGSDSATRAGGTLATALLAFAATALAL